MAARLWWLWIVAAVAALPASARAQSAPDAGRPFEPQPQSLGLYDVSAPQARKVPASDGVQLWTDTWLPVKRAGGPAVPDRIPTILELTPYRSRGAGGPWRTYFVSRGYAYTAAHLRGTGASQGCRDYFGPKDVDDAGTVIQWVGRDAPWSDGNVGMYGISYPGGTQVMAAGLADPKKTSYLKAIVPSSPGTSTYADSFHDGVAEFLKSHATEIGYLQQTSLLLAPGTGGEPTDYPGKLECQPEHIPGATNVDGDYLEYFAKREPRKGSRNIRAATLVSHGTADNRVSGGMMAGFFDELPKDTPKAGLFGVYSHEYPDDHDFNEPPVRPEWEREDWLPMVLAWYDRWLKGLDTGVEEWPVAQVQGSDGQWRTAADWPVVGGRHGQLALGPGGRLGVRVPGGSDSYREGAFETTGVPYPPGMSLVYETGPLGKRLELTGQPVLDLWATLDRPDAHVAVRLEALDASGGVVEYPRPVGLRSAQHLEPFVHSRFEQAKGVPAPVNRPIRIPIRLEPTDLVVPEGGRLRLTIAGSVQVTDGLDTIREGAGAVFQGPSQPSGAATVVTVLHDCAHPSALRFEMPSGKSELLNVREPDETGALADNTDARKPAVTGGVARSPVCGAKPVAPASVLDLGGTG